MTDDFAVVREALERIPGHASGSAAIAALDRIEAERDEAREDAERLAGAAAEAATSLSTGPMKDGYAYSILCAALAAHEGRKDADA